MCPASQRCHPLTVNSTFYLCTLVRLLVVGCVQLPAQSCSVNLGQFHTVLPSDNSQPTNKPKLLILTKFRHSKQAPILHQLGRNISHRWTERTDGKENSGNTYLRTTDSFLGDRCLCVLACVKCSAVLVCLYSREQGGPAQMRERRVRPRSFHPAPLAAAVCYPCARLLLN